VSINKLIFLFLIWIEAVDVHEAIINVWLVVTFLQSPPPPPPPNEEPRLEPITFSFSSEDILIILNIL
jgi:hypothetical protein